MNRKDFIDYITMATIFIGVPAILIIGIVVARPSSPVEGTKVDTIFVNNVIHDTIYINIIEKDTILEQEYNRLREKCIVDEYKLERIRYYNKVAANGNNIKFLRGWINRVLDNKE